MGFYPDLEKLLQIPSKSKLLVLHRSLRSSIGLLLLFGALVLAVYVLALFAIDGEETSARGWGLLIRVLALLPVCVLLEVVRRYYNDIYIVGRDKVTHYRGRISLRFATPSIRNIDLRQITVAQGLLGRILDFGDVSLATAGQEGAEICISGIRSPHELAKLIDELRHKSQRASLERATTEQVVLQSLPND